MDEAQVQRDDVTVHQGVSRKPDGVLSRGSLSDIPPLPTLFRIADGVGFGKDRKCSTVPLRGPPGDHVQSSLFESLALRT